MEFAEFIRTPRVEEVTLYRANMPPLEGTLCVTGHHLIISRRQDDDEEELWVLCFFVCFVQSFD
jgi:myotubularin-related protein 9